MTSSSVSTLATNQTANLRDQEGPANGPRFAGMFWPTLASVIALAIGSWSLTQLSPTIDEWGYVQFGVKFWFGGDSDWLIHVGVLPLPFWIQNAPGALYLKLKHGTLPGGIEGNFGFSLTLADQLAVLYLARSTNLILTSPATIYLVWLLTNRLFGRVAANFSALYCAIEPNLLAGYILATADAAIVPTCLSMMILYEDHLRHRKLWKLLVIGGFYGLGIGLKISALPTGLLMLWACVLGRLFEQFAEPGLVVTKVRHALHELVRFSMHAVLFLVIGLSLSWAANGFLRDYLLSQDTPNTLAYRVINKLGYRREVATTLVERLRRTLVPVPISVFRSQVGHSQVGHPMTFRGVAGQRGPWYYYPYIFTMKTHLVLLLISVASLLRKGVWRSPVFLGSLHLLALSLTNKIHGGPRYFLALYSLMASLAGVGTAAMLGMVVDWRLKSLLGALLAAGALTLTARSAPQFLTHTSPLWGGDAEGYRFADANYDWGQGLFLAFAAADRAGLKPVAFLHSGDPHYGVPSDRKMIFGTDVQLIARAVQGKFLVVSVHELYHSEAEAPNLMPLYRALREIGVDGRLTDTAFYFDLRSPERCAELMAALGRVLGP